MYKTVKDLKERLKDVPDDYEIRYSRIEDIYFNEHGWGSPSVSKKMVDLCMHQEGEGHDEYCYTDYVQVVNILVNHDEKCVQLTAHY